MSEGIVAVTSQQVLASCDEEGRGMDVGLVVGN